MVESGVISQIEQDFKTAMLSKNATAKSALRLLKTAIATEEKKTGNILNEEQLTVVIQKHVKSLDTQIQTYTDLNQSEIVTSLNTEKLFCSKYLPEVISKEELDELINVVLDNYPAEDRSVKSMGKIMEMVRILVKDSNKIVDNSLLAKKVKLLLNA